VLAAQTQGDETGFRYRFSYGALQDFRKQADAFSDVFAFELGLGGLNAEGKTTQFLYSVVSGNFFSALGIKPAAGRFLLPGEGEHSGAERQIVLGYGVWQKRFGGLASAVGKQVRVDGKPARIIGVAPQEFHGVYAGADIDGYMPLDQMASLPFFESPQQLYTSRTLRRLTVMARLKPGRTLREAQVAMDVLMRRLGDEYPATDRGLTARVVPEQFARPVPLPRLAEVIPFVRGFVLVLGGMVLLLACMNVANLLMVRATARQREMGIRAALGSGRARLVRQMLTESILLSFIGAAAGVALGKWGKDAFAASIDLATDFPTLLDFRFDWRVFLYALGAATVTGILIGLWPALRASRAEAGAVLHDGRTDSGGGGGHREKSRSPEPAGDAELGRCAGIHRRAWRRTSKSNRQTE